MARPRSRSIDYLVYLAVRWVVAFAQILSVEQSYTLARFMARIFYRLNRRHREVGLENLRLAFGDTYSLAERDQIVRQVYEHFCMMMMEILHIPRKLHPTTWRDRITLVGHEAVLERLIEGGPLIMLSGHFGNWEMAGYLFGVFGYPPHSVARTLDNPYLDRFLRKFRERTGQKLIPKNGGYDDMLHVLRTGGVLSFLADQDAGQRGLYVDFFGRPASTHKAIALLAIEHQAPIVVGYARRIGPGFRYEVGCEDVIHPDDLTGGPDDVRLLTQRYTAALESVIRRSPEQYLWLHRRWKHQPKPRGKAARTAASTVSSDV
ncbi:MAG: lysophospholipid acyltransferase family protein [Isosphaeraceae bacterium]